MGAGWPGIALQLALQNTGAASAKLDALDALWWADSRGELELPGPARALRWIDPGPHGAAPARSAPLRGRLHAPCAAVLGAPGFAGLTLGFLGWREHSGAIEASARGGAPAELSIRNPLGVALPGGQRVLGDRIWIGLDGASDDGLARWAERAGLEWPGPPRAPLSTWCMGEGASAQAAIELARALREHELPVDAIRIDSDFAQQPGDWLSPGHAFPAGFEPVAKELGKLGFDLALRIAPFAALRSSDLARAHRDWLLRQDARTAAGPRAVLDLAQEPVVAWLEALASGLRERGARHLWLDELWLGLLCGGARPAAVYRRALEALRRGIGPDAFVAGMAAPFAASTGLLDALQLEPERPVQRQRRWWRRRQPEPQDLELRAGLSGRLAHAQTAVLALDDGDVARQRRSAIASAICGATSLGGDPARVPAAGWRLARRLLPPAALRPARVPGVPGALVASEVDGTRLLALLRQAEEFDLAWVFGSAPVRVFDAWRARERASASGSLRFESPEGTGPQLLRLTPADGQPRLVGSSLHLTAGAAELARCEAQPGCGLALELALPGPREGSIHLQAPDPGRLRLRVAFRDRLELLADSSVFADPD